MTEKKRQPRKLKGVVLVMVVTLLCVLVIMLMATLTVVANANKRTVTKFEENQAYYTARSALEVYIDEILEYGDNTDRGSTGAMYVAKALSEKFDDINETNCLGLQKADGSYSDFSGRPITDGFIYQQELFGYLVPKYQLDGVSQGDELTNYREDGIWKERKNWKTIQDQSQHNYKIDYKAELPDMGGVTAAGDNAGIMTNDDVDVSVELLRMVYLDKERKVVTDGTMSGAMLADVDWNNTYFRLKITATAKIKQGTGGINESTVTVLLEPGTVMVKSKTLVDEAIDTDKATTGHDDINVYGGAKSTGNEGLGANTDDDSPDFSIFKAQNPSSFVGNFMLDYDRVICSTEVRNWIMTPSESYVVPNGSIMIDNAGYNVIGSGRLDTPASEQAALNQRPFFYSKGLYVNSNGMTIGQPDPYSGEGYACDIIAVANRRLLKDTGKDQEALAAKFASAGADAGNMAAYFSNNGPTKVYGDVYIDGDMYIDTVQGVNFYGNIYCTGSIYIDGNAVNAFNNNQMFHKDVYVGGNVYKMDGWPQVPVEAANALVHPADTNMIAQQGDNCTFNLANYWDPDNVEAYTLTLPTNGSSPLKRGQVTIQTTESKEQKYKNPLTDDYITALEMFQKMSGCDDVSLNVKGTAPFLKKGSDSPKVTKTVYMFKKETTDPSTGKTTVKVRTSFENTMAAGETPVYSETINNVIDPTDSSVAAYNADTDFCEMKLNATDFQNDGGTYFIDATKKNVQIETYGWMDSATPNFVVVGDKSVVFTFPKNKQTNATVWLEGGLTKTAPTFSMKTFTVQSYEIYRLIQDHGVFNLGNEANPSGSPEFPQIYMFLEEGVDYDCRNYNGVTCGLLYGPDSELSFSGNGGPDLKFTYNGVGDVENGAPNSARTAGAIQWCGAIIVDQAHIQNKWGIFFPNQSSDDNSESPKGGLIKWERQRYLNR